MPRQLLLSEPPRAARRRLSASRSMRPPAPGPGAPSTGAAASSSSSRTPTSASAAPRAGARGSTNSAGSDTSGHAGARGKSDSSGCPGTSRARPGPSWNGYEVIAYGAALVAHRYPPSNWAASLSVGSGTQQTLPPRPPRQGVQAQAPVAAHPACVTLPSTPCVHSKCVCEGFVGQLADIDRATLLTSSHGGSTLPCAGTKSARPLAP
jgi:hypothetical protein